MAIRIVDTVPFRDAGFTTILGAELHSGAMSNGELWHILAVGLPPVLRPRTARISTPVPGRKPARRSPPALWPPGPLSPSPIRNGPA